MAARATTSRTASAAKTTTRKTAAKPAAKATATRSRAAKPEPVEDDDDLLGGLEKEAKASTQEDDDEGLDLLSMIGEDAGTPWVPWADGYEEQPNGIQGTVTHVGTVTQDEKYGGGEVAYLEILDRDGETQWSVRGYATVLNNQIEKASPEVGDRIGILYRGLKANRKGDNDYHDFGVVVKRAR